MSFSVSFFARDVRTARARLQDVYAPMAVKALVELAIAGIPVHPLGSAGATHAGTSAPGRSHDAAKDAPNRPAPQPQQLRGIRVETHGHIDEFGGRSSIGTFRVEPYYD